MSIDFPLIFKFSMKKAMGNHKTMKKAEKPPLPEQKEALQ